MKSMETLTETQSLEITPLQETQLKILITKVMYNSCSGLGRLYSLFIKEDGSFDKDKWNEFVTDIIARVKNKDIIFFPNQFEKDHFFDNISWYRDETTFSEQINFLFYGMGHELNSIWNREIETYLENYITSQKIELKQHLTHNAIKNILES